MPALLFLGFPPFPPVGKSLLIRSVSGMEDVEERQAGVTVEVREARVGE
jgi:Fe2+ transport system protein B